MKLIIDGIRHGEPIPGKFAFGIPDEQDHVALSENRNPRLRWTVVPESARSLVLICVDCDVPSQPDDVNKEDREVPASLKRTDFYHWVMVDIPTDISEIAEGVCSDGITPHGKDDPWGPEGARQGLNGYTDWFDIEAGVRQGCILSPLLYSIFINGLAEAIKRVASRSSG